MSLKIKKILFIVGGISIFFFFLTPLAVKAEECSWVTKKMTYEGGYNNPTTTIDCAKGEVVSDEICKKESVKPIGSGSQTGTTVYVCCCTPDIEIAKEQPKTALFTIPDFQVEIPGLNKLATITCVVGEECNIPWIGQYVAGIYNYALAIVGIIAAIILMAGGLIWLISAGDASKITKAKELIIGSISGLVILLASYTILTIVNPDLVNLKGVNVSSLSKIVISPVKNGSDSAENAIGTCASDRSIKAISELVSTNAASPYLVPEAISGLTSAITEAKKQGVELRVVSAFRTSEHQQELWDNALETYGDPIEARKWVAQPGSCGGHRSGKAIDVCIKDTESCNHIGGGANAKYTDADVEKLKEIMRAAGWVRYCGEWWHYQYHEPQNNPCP